eukprot:4630650-Amphidinium_carterae.1
MRQYAVTPTEALSKPGGSIVDVLCEWTVVSMHQVEDSNMCHSAARCAGVVNSSASVQASR